MISALFVATNGVYFNHPKIDPWDEIRDARKFNGPGPVIAHPPCARWGRYWSGGPSAKVRRKLGDDGGLFKFAISMVQKYGGILEHPEASKAWAAFGLMKPPRRGGWVKADSYGWTCCVEQGHYGHRARKATWLYLVGTPKELKWGPSQGERLDEGFRSNEHRKQARALGQKPVKRLSVVERLSTPIQFRDLLISLVIQP